MAVFDKVMVVIFIILTIVGILWIYIDNSKTKNILKQGCEGKELTDYKIDGWGVYELECDNVVRDGTFFISKGVYCEEFNKWGDCINYKRKDKKLERYDEEINDANEVRGN